jgi:hypothetical protein
MYAFTDDSTWRARLLASTRSGSLVFNDVMAQLACAFARASVRPALSLTQLVRSE